MQDDLEAFNSTARAPVVTVLTFWNQEGRVNQYASTDDSYFSVSFPLQMDDEDEDDILKSMEDDMTSEGAIKQRKEDNPYMRTGIAHTATALIEDEAHEFVHQALECTPNFCMESDMLPV